MQKHWLSQSNFELEIRTPPQNDFEEVITVKKDTGEVDLKKSVLSNFK
jgi:hypothetical protein